MSFHSSNSLVRGIPHTMRFRTAFHRRHRTAFTLIELTVVLVVASLLASLTALSLRSYVDRAELARAVDSILAADRQARRLALVSPQASVSLRLEAAQILVVMGPQSRKFSIPKSMTLGRFEVRSPQRGLHADESIRFASNGVSSSYLMQVGRRDSRAWIVVLGVSGQAIRCDNLESARELLK